MAPSFDCVASSLLCEEEEDDYGIFCDEVDCGDSVADWADDRNQNSCFDESLTGLPEQNDEFLASMVTRECEHLPNADYLKRLRNGELDLGARMESLQWIRKVLAHFNFGPLCAYLSMNYFDRFLSTCELPKDKAWTMKLLAVACLSLAAKVEETDVPSCLDLQVGVAKFVFEAKTIERMELLVLSSLRWRMQAITPFSFIDYFLRKIIGDEAPQTALISRSTELILGIIQDFLEFKPSEIAAAVAMSVSGEAQTVDIDKTIPLLSDHVQKERLLNCIAMIHGEEASAVASGSLKVSSASTTTSVPRSPIGVLDASCLSFKTDDATVGSCANSSYKSPHSSSNKRRKLNTPHEVEI